MSSRYGAPGSRSHSPAPSPQPSAAAAAAAAAAHISSPSPQPSPFMAAHVPLPVVRSSSISSTTSSTVSHHLHTHYHSAPSASSSSSSSSTSSASPTPYQQPPSLQQQPPHPPIPSGSFSASFGSSTASDPASSASSSELPPHHNNRDGVIDPAFSRSLPGLMSRSASIAGSDAGGAGPGGDSEFNIVMHTAPRRSSVSRLDKRGTIHPAQLITYTSFGGKNHFPLFREETKIGRKESGNHVVLLGCAKISKFHAVVLRKDDGYYVKDANSSNGVYVNNVLIPKPDPYKLRDNDKLKIGSIELTFIDEIRHDSPPSNAANPTNKRESMMPREVEENVKLVTILPSEKRYEESMTISAEFAAGDDDSVGDFRRVGDVQDPNTLREDYEKLRLAYELSKINVAQDITPLLAKSMDLMFEILPVDRGVVLLVDEKTSHLVTHYVKLREGKANEGREILLSSTILRKVMYSRVALVTRDAYEDPMLGKAASIRYGQIRSVICVPLIAHNKVLGILHLDSRDRINASFSPKDLSLVKAVSNQTAVALENMILLNEVEQKAILTEQLSRFLAPHVVDKMAKRANLVQSRRKAVGTILFADIRGFTNFSEAHGAAEVVDLLNDYFERLVRIVFKYEGVVDKYIGDALMAVFGTLEDEVDSEYRSVAAALEFIDAINEMNKERSAQGKPPISIGVGVNTGELVTGFIGSPQRLEYTSIGDTVNTSSRICSMAGKDQVLISDTTYQQIKDLVVVNQVGYRQFKGKTQEVMVYQALSIKKKEAI
ncbi:hypothetical protein DFJ73DRAFT_524033 [Zopfochytrium polystomum]|nr:hypothetical protein DFJ73DRAFT_524033 [Zopfochytrium polystomum]